MKLLTNCSDNSPSKEERGTEVPQTGLEWQISRWSHSCSHRWNHLLQQEEEKEDPCIWLESPPVSIL